jgi:hypothetical protein
MLRKKNPTKFDIFQARVVGGGMLFIILSAAWEPLDTIIVDAFVMFIVGVLATINGIVMILFPRRFCELPPWLRAQGVLLGSEDMKRGSIRVRATGVAMLIFAVFMMSTAAVWYRR